MADAVQILILIKNKELEFLLLLGFTHYLSQTSTDKPFPFVRGEKNPTRVKHDKENSKGLGPLRDQPRDVGIIAGLLGTL